MSLGAGTDIKPWQGHYQAPQMTTAQRTAIPTAVNGMGIYNSTDSVMQFYQGGAWTAFLGLGGGTLTGILNTVGLNSQQPTATAASQTYNAAPTANTITGANAMTYTGNVYNVVIPAYSPVANTTSMTLRGIAISQGVITNAADTCPLTVTALTIEAAHGAALVTGIYTWRGIDITLPNQAANGAANAATGLFITGMTQSAAGTQRGIYVSMSATIHDAIYVAQGSSYFGGHIGIMAASSATITLYSNETINAPATIYSALDMRLKFTGNPAGNDIINIILMEYAGSVASSGSHYGLTAIAYNSSGQNLTAGITTPGLVGLEGRAYHGSNAGTTTSLIAVWASTWGSATAGGTVTNAVGMYVTSPAVTGTLTNAYGLYLENITGAGSLNYAIYAAGGLSYFASGFQEMLTASVTADSQSLNAAPSATTLTAANTKSFTGIAQNIVIPAITPAANGAGITMTGLNFAQGAISNVADSEAITVKMITATGAANPALTTGIYTWTWADITMPAQGANGAANVATGLKITGGTASASGTQRGIDITMAAATDAALKATVGYIAANNIYGIGTANLTINGNLALTDATARSLILNVLDSTADAWLPMITLTPNAAAPTMDFNNRRISNAAINTRVGTIADSAAPTPNADTDDMYTVTALAQAATFGAPTGTPVNGQKLMIRILDNATARALAWNAIYVARGVALPTTTVISKYLYVGFIYNSAASKWDCIASAAEA